MQSFASRYNGTCKICFARITKGEQIVWNRSVKGQVAHSLCYTNAGEKFPVIPTNDTEVRINDEIVYSEQTTLEPVTITAPTTDLASLIAASVAPLVKVQREEIVNTILDVLETFDLGSSNTVIKKIEVVNPVTNTTVEMGQQHEKFETLLQACMARGPKGERLNIWLCGPAGSSKTTSAENVGKALGLERIVVLPKLSESYTFFGYHIPGTGEYKRTPARDVWEFGGMLVMDDFDGTDPNIATELNAPLANGTCMFPDGMIPRHPDCLIILTANTWGHGATSEYVGRLKQDAAFMNRFIPVNWPIDENLERSTVGNDKWVSHVQKIRGKVAAKGIKVLITPRQSYFGAALLQVGMAWSDVENMVLKGSMSDEQWKAVQ